MFTFAEYDHMLYLANFEGPLSLLLDLIDRSSLDITELALAQVTSQYLDFLQTMQQNKLELSSEFFAIAAHLIYIKSRMLLPRTSDTEEAPVEGDLVHRLREYKEIVQLARKLKTAWHAAESYYTRGAFPKEKIVSLDTLTTGHLLRGIQRYRGALLRKPIPIKRRKINIEERMRFIQTLLQERKQCSFSQLCLIVGEQNKNQHIANFVASIELAFHQVLSLEQEATYAEFYLRRKES